MNALKSENTTKLVGTHFFLCMFLHAHVGNESSRGAMGNSERAACFTVLPAPDYQYVCVPDIAMLLRVGPVQDVTPQRQAINASKRSAYIPVQVVASIWKESQCLEWQA